MVIGCYVESHYPQNVEILENNSCCGQKNILDLTEEKNQRHLLQIKPGTAGKGEIAEENLMEISKQI